MAQKGKVALWILIVILGLAILATPFIYFNYLCCGYGGVHLAHSAAEYLYSVLFGKFSAFKHFLKEGVLALHCYNDTNFHIYKYNKNIATFAAYGQK